MENQFNAFNYLVPATGTVSGFNIQNVFTALLSYTKNFQQLEVDAAEFNPSGIFIDNSLGLGSLIITIVDTGQRIVTAPGSVKQVQYPAPMNHSVTIVSDIGNAETGQASVTFVDFPVMPFESSVTATKSTGKSAVGTVDATGTQVLIPASRFNRHATVQNRDAANDLFVSFNTPALVTDFKLSPGQAMTFPSNGFSNALYGLSSGATTAFSTIGA